MTFGDVVCCGNRLWTCGVSVPNIAFAPQGTGLSAGQVINSFKDASVSGDIQNAAELCDQRINIVSGSEVKTDVICTGLGFLIRQHTGESIPPTLGFECSQLDETICEQQRGCYLAANKKCRTCAQTTSCSTYNNDFEACEICPVEPNNCHNEIVAGGKTDFLVCSPS
jgi:hypothetical protein